MQRVDESSTVAEGVLCWSRREFDYGPKSLKKGELVTLAGAKNDEQLIRLRYLIPVGPGDKPVKGKDRRQYISETFRRLAEGGDA